jgi:hypothetical protein
LEKVRDFDWDSALERIDDLQEHEMKSCAWSLSASSAFGYTP